MKIKAIYCISIVLYISKTVVSLPIRRKKNNGLDEKENSIDLFAN